MQRPTRERRATTRPRKDKAKDSPTRVPTAWKRLLSGQAPDAPESARNGGPTLGFFLEMVQDEGCAGARLEIAPVLLSVGDKGNLFHAVPLDPRRLAQTPLPSTDQRLATSLLGLPYSQRKGRNYAHLHGAVGDALLSEILDTSPCFLGGVAGLRLSRSQPHRPAWTWRIDADGLQHLEPELPTGQRLLRAGTPWYLDPEHATLGPLELEADETHLIDAPPLTPEDAEAVAAALAKSPLAKRVPAPQVLSKARTTHLAPQPVLTLRALIRHARLAAGTPPLAYARLSFDYGGERLPSRGGEHQVHRVREGKLIEITRRRADELAAMERLENAGLTPAVDTEGLPWDLADTLPDDAWLFPGAGHTGALDVNTPARWMALRGKLEDDGFLLDYDASFPFEVLEGPVHWYGEASAGRDDDRFELEIGIEVDGQKVNLLPAVAQALGDQQLSLTPPSNEAEDAVWYAPVDDRRRVPVRLRELRAMLAPLAEYLEKPRTRLRLPKVQAGRLEELSKALPTDGKLEAPRALRGFTRRLREAAERASDTVPTGLNATLRDYQREGLRWLNALDSAGVGGVLADDMGLGKTLQMLAHLQTLKEAGRLKHPVLVVLPTSLIPNWESEAARFVPELSVLTLHGPQRSEHFDRIAGHDLILTSYALLPRDLDVLKEQRFELIVLDEAQQVKNPRTQARRALLKLKAGRLVCLTGTPLENHLGELWSQLDLAVPGLLGDERAFRRHYRVPIEKQNDEACQQRLNQRLAPFILRRSKAEVASELPAKTEITRRVVLDGRQRDLYESLRLSLADELREVIAQRGIEHSGIIVLDALLKLRQACCDPRLVKLEAARGVRESAKMDLLLEMLPALVAEGRKVLLFSQFTEMLKLIARELDRKRIRYVVLTGETRDRAEPVRRFQEGEVPLFLLSLKAGGVGLNLTAADTVIHYDPWWNPAAEAQAADRAHRIGQDKPVFVYKLITAGTVEERIETMKERKAELAAAVLEGGGSRDRLKFDQDDLDALLAAEPVP